jgi:hypothetical protein
MREVVAAVGGKKRPIFLKPNSGERDAAATVMAS